MSGRIEVVEGGDPLRLACAEALRRGQGCSRYACATPAAYAFLTPDRESIGFACRSCMPLVGAAGFYVLDLASGASVLGPDGELCKCQECTGAPSDGAS